MSRRARPDDEKIKNGREAGDLLTRLRSKRVTTCGSVEGERHQATRRGSSG
ncbi:MAG: hypothetical protein ACKOB4_06755 [Acidobacteriota bacterium]